MGNAQADYVIAEPRDLRVHQSSDGSTPVDQSGDSTDDVTVAAHSKTITLENVDDTWSQLQKWVDITDSKVNTPNPERVTVIAHTCCYYACVYC